MAPLGQLQRWTFRVARLGEIRSISSMFIYVSEISRATHVGSKRDVGSNQIVRRDFVYILGLFHRYNPLTIARLRSPPAPPAALCFHPLTC